MTAPPLVIAPWVRDGNGDCRFCAPDEKCALCLALDDGRAVLYARKWPDDFRGFGTNVRPPKQP